MKAVDRELLLGGLAVVAGWLLILSFFQSNTVTTFDEVVRVEGRTRYVTGLETVAAQFSLATQVQILAAFTLVIGFVASVVTARSLSGARAWFSSLQWIIAGLLLGFVTAMPFRMWLPPQMFWPVVGPLYILAVVAVVGASRLGVASRRR